MSPGSGLSIERWLFWPRREGGGGGCVGMHVVDYSDPRQFTWSQVVVVVDEGIYGQ